MSEIDPRELEAFLQRSLEVSLGRADSPPTEEEWKAIALRAGLDEREWNRLCERLAAHLCRGRSFLKHGNPKDAVRELEEAAALAPYRADVLADCGRAHLLLWQETGSESSREASWRRLQACLELQPDHDEAAAAISEWRKSKNRMRKAGWKAKFAWAAVAALALAGGLAWFAESRETTVAPSSGDASVVEPSAIAIPADAVRLGTRSFKIFREDISWHDAKKRCEEMGGRLAVVNDTETLALIDKMKGIQRLWLGATDEHEEGDWRWVDGTPVTIQAWGPRQPFNLFGKEHYMELGPEGWFNDVAANGPTEKFRINGFVCEWELGGAAEMRVVGPAGG